MFKKKEEKNNNLIENYIIGETSEKKVTKELNKLEKHLLKEKSFKNIKKELGEELLWEKTILDITKEMWLWNTIEDFQTKLDNETQQKIISLEIKRGKILESIVINLYSKSVNFIIKKLPNVPSFLATQNGVLKQFYLSHWPFYNDVMAIIILLVKEEIESVYNNYKKEIIKAKEENNFNEQIIFAEYKRISFKIENSIVDFFEKVSLDKELFTYFLIRKWFLIWGRKFKYLHNFYENETNKTFFKNNYKINTISKNDDFLVYYDNVATKVLFLFNSEKIRVKTIDLLQNYYNYFKNYYGVLNENFYFTLLNETDFKKEKKAAIVLKKKDVSKIERLSVLPLKQYLINSMLWKAWDFTAYFIETEVPFASFGMEWDTSSWTVYKVIPDYLENNYDSRMFFDDLKDFFDFNLNGVSTIEEISIWTVNFRLSVLQKEKYTSVSIRNTSDSSDYYTEEDLKKFWITTKITKKDGEVINLIWDNNIVNNQKWYVNYQKEQLEAFENMWYNIDTFHFELKHFLSEKDVGNFEKVLWYSTGVWFVCGVTWSWKSTFLKTLYWNYMVEEAYKNNYFNKIIFLESPIEGVNLNLYKIPYDLQDPNDLKNIIINIKTQKPNMTVVWETKDPYTFQEAVSLGDITQTATTLHVWTIQGFLTTTLNDFLEDNDLAPNVLEKTNYILILRKLKKTKNKIEGNFKDKDKIEKYFLNLFLPDEKTAEKDYLSIFMSENEKKEQIEQNKQTIKKIKENIIKLTNSKKLNILNIEGMTEEEKTQTLKEAGKRVYVHYELFFKNGVAEFVRNLKERNFKAMADDAKNWYKYGGIENTFEYKSLLAYLKGEILPEVNSWNTLYGNYFQDYSSIQQFDVEKKLAITEQLLKDLS